ncbi:aminotransferase class V-fold PLP-dependent enzyme [Nitratireductor aquimarinus]|uniref:aminotransferase class V-fold PLP-dependent enzyme n=1 Tax=Nitratireductor TaxID=245876 RepID=UPI0019D40BE6|nr:MULTISPECIES: aminotransferase class V-fold PLP-dependent enzyme [Nitratireductor]MBN7775723.1 aminotransferase class V-fold PLP-dependent enzyme [Nitratireductor pacificus]MBN7781812.1 aminotransferase class V-fold PLP-dependent enzyme [Nitratireductor pacificus]MBN7790618.1 aminotransferase class V-fold PLP-dependent enzyme [Nitratireductor aquimarinus]MBY6098470.1 aminotransferase class V-fold PLP-dependent enzyme [Nitratireductor aquimarinus]MCA1261805.1 aminotransferase class V-fold PL
MPSDLLKAFADNLKRTDLDAYLRDGLIGENAVIDGPFGKKTLVYADYVASGRALAQVEDFIRDEVLPYYANSHTEASYCGSFCTRLRQAARAEIHRIVNADDKTSVVFSGAGATAGINRLVRLLQISEAVAAGARVVVFTGPYEHHSNILPWRESGAEIIAIPEAATGGPDLGALATALEANADAALKVGTFSAASNVTGITTDTNAVTRLLKAHGALAIWDYAGGAPYLEIDMKPGTDCAKDAVVLSPHKFPGGPGASGLLVLRNEIARTACPSMPGGGSVSFVSPWGHEYSTSLSAREEAGTPDVLGDIRAALVLIIKEALGQDFIDRRHEELHQRAIAVWSKNPCLQMLGNPAARRLPIYSFRILCPENGTVHHQLFTRMLSDLHGIQVRGGCACAGPYAHQLLEIDEPTSNALLQSIRDGQEMEKPGWVRLNLSYLMTDEKADFIIETVDRLAREAQRHAGAYDFDPRTARFRHKTLAMAG